MSYQHQTQQIKTYSDDTGCYDVIVSLCCGSFITVSFTVLMIFLVNKEDEIINGSGSI